MDNVSQSTCFHKWHVFAIFYVLPRTSHEYIWCGFIPSTVWRFSNYFSNSLDERIGSDWYGSATTTDTKVIWRCYWPCLCVTAATSIYDAFSGSCQLPHGFSTGRFLFENWVSHCFVYYMFGICSSVCFLLSGSCWMPYSPLGAQLLGLAPLQPIGAYPWQAYVQPGDGHWPTLGMHRVAAPFTTLSRGGPFCYLISYSPTTPSIWWDIHLWGLDREPSNPSAFPAWWGGVFFSRSGSIQWHGQLWICDGH